MSVEAVKGSDLRDQISQADAAFEVAYASGDAAALSDLYDPEGMILPPGSERLAGRAAIREFWQGVMDMGVKRISLLTAEVQGDGDLAVERGDYQLEAANAEVVDHGKYVVVWHRNSDGWQLHRDIWNTSRPPDA